VTPQPPSGADTLVICVATFRRPEGLRRLLVGIASQSYHSRPPPRVRVIVVDNEVSAEAKALCDATATELGLDLQYVAEPRPGIAHARNAALDVVTASDDWLCFIDDDEVPTESWLEALLAAQRQTGAECVAGRVVPVFPPGTPRWIVGGSFFGTKRSRTGVMVPATSNSMISRAAVERLGLRFDTTLEGAGGEDTLFFRQAARGGVRIAWTDAAIVHEYVVPGRLRLSRVMRRQFREGSTLAQCDLAMGATWFEKGGRLAKGGGLLAVGVLTLPLCVILGFDVLARASCRLARGVGTLAGLAGVRFEEYRPDRNRDA
jgi:glycosyltransferase involved in cell wall biosynthesis